jgi:hypothetical protein
MQHKSILSVDDSFEPDVRFIKRMGQKNVISDLTQLMMHSFENTFFFFFTPA